MQASPRAHPEAPRSPSNSERRSPLETIPLSTIVNFGALFLLLIIVTLLQYGIPHTPQMEGPPLASSETQNRNQDARAHKSAQTQKNMTTVSQHARVSLPAPEPTPEHPRINRTQTEQAMQRAALPKLSNDPWSEDRTMDIAELDNEAARQRYRAYNHQWATSQGTPGASSPAVQAFPSSQHLQQDFIPFER